MTETMCNKLFVSFTIVVWIFALNFWSVADAYYRSISGMYAMSGKKHNFSEIYCQLGFGPIEIHTSQENDVFERDLKQVAKELYSDVNTYHFWLGARISNDHWPSGIMIDKSLFYDQSQLHDKDKDCAFFRVQDGQNLGVGDGSQLYHFFCMLRGARLSPAYYFIDDIAISRHIESWNGTEVIPPVGYELIELYSKKEKDDLAKSIFSMFGAGVELKFWLGGKGQGSEKTHYKWNSGEKILDGLWQSAKLKILNSKPACVFLHSKGKSSSLGALGCKERLFKVYKKIEYVDPTNVTYANLTNGTWSEEQQHFITDVPLNSYINQLKIKFADGSNQLMFQNQLLKQLLGNEIQIGPNSCYNSGFSNDLHDTQVLMCTGRNFIHRLTFHAAPNHKDVKMSASCCPLSGFAIGSCNYIPMNMNKDNWFELNLEKDQVLAGVFSTWEIEDENRIKAHRAFRFMACKAIEVS